MTIEKEERLKVLYSYFRGDWRAIPFKGSKAQKKNALKEYKKLLEEKSSEKRAQKEAKIAALQQTIKSCKWSLENNFTKFWWEVMPLNAYDECVKRLQEAEAELAALQ